MEDGVPEAESLLHPKEGDDDEKDNHQESGEERSSGSFINHIFSNLVSRGEGEHREEEGEEEESEEKRGGLLDSIIPNLISPLSKKEEQNEAFQVRDGEGTSEDQVKKKQKVTTGVDEANERAKAEEEGGGGIIDHIVSRLPTSLPVDALQENMGLHFFLLVLILWDINARGLKKHLKRLNAPKHWMLDKLGGAFAPKPSSGPHKSRECLPLILILRNRLKYALTYREVIAILMQRHVLVDGKVRTDKTYPSGFMDVVSIPKTNESFRLLYDTKGRFRLHSLRDEEAKVNELCLCNFISLNGISAAIDFICCLMLVQFKLCKVRSIQFGQKGIPYLNTYDGRTIRYPDPLIKANDTIKLDLESNKIVDFIKFDVGNVVMVTGGRNRGRVGVIKNREKHKGSFETIHVQDASGHEFATRLGNVFTIGKGSKPWISLPKGKGIKLSIIEEARKRQAASQTAA
ncbi:hypothetical protein POTOM_025262 [Populus tomentosa]|uniref:KOW domain-containing protein n=1 Tax=Populus tomentosa TaxID=118781 RepID=A0A8X8CX80_POPTO|nr:hypothetical protein POTOM_025262 [Populus tomentosa]